MNQTVANQDINTLAAAVAPDAKPAVRLRDIDILTLQTALTAGENGMAKRKDIAELHKRLVAILTTINTDFGENQMVRIAEDRSQLVAKLDEVERSINGMEGALRIELEPMLRAIVNETIEKRVAPRSGRVAATTKTALALTIGVVIGTMFSAEISRVAAAIVSTYASIISE